MLFLLMAAAVGVFALAHAAPFPFLLDKMGPAPSIWSMPAAPGTRVVYLTFDDGPNTAWTPKVLDVLESERAKATFFLIDRNLTEHTAPVVKRMFAEGHAVGLHSDTHGLAALSPREVASTLTAAASRIERMAGARPCRAFRPHGGWRSRRMLAGLARIDHALVGWGFLLWDWNWFRERTPESILSRVLGHVSPGSIIVIHDGHHANPLADRSYAIEATRRLIPELRARGYSFGTICDPSNGSVPGSVTR